MKKLTLASAVKAALAVAITAVSMSAFAAPEIYGQVRMSVLYEDINGDNMNARPNLATGNSRIGFKGNEKFNANTDLDYRLEYRVQVAEADGTNFGLRHGYLKLNNKQYGSLLVGRTLSEDEQIAVSDAWWRGVGVGYTLGHDSDWSSNTIIYTTPKFNGGKTEAALQYGMDEGATASRKLGSSVGERDFVVARVSHDTGKGTLGASYTMAGDDLKSLRVSGTHQLNDRVKLSGLAQYADYNTKDNEIGGFVGVALKKSQMDPMTLWVEGYYANNHEGVKDVKSSGVNVGAQYDFSKSTFGFANVGYADKGTEDKKGVEVGVVHKF